MFPARGGVGRLSNRQASAIRIFSLAALIRAAISMFFMDGRWERLPLAKSPKPVYGNSPTCPLRPVVVLVRGGGGSFFGG